mmetsp:Transcript_1223/g.4650  ORF Transcript_1223/g.4650 Transcript_1223/m.4650 type:complete len:224 (+) Transcript_1223:1642-2313(+)
MASSSSRSTTHGASFAAAAKTPFSAASDSPTAAVTSSGPLTTRRLAPASAAAARANRVLPAPGGPHSNTPRGGLTPHLVKSSGFCSGNSTSSFRDCMNEETPPNDAYPPDASDADANARPARSARRPADNPGSFASSLSSESSSASFARRSWFAFVFVASSRDPLRLVRDSNRTDVPAPTTPLCASSTTKYALAPRRGNRTKLPGSKHRPSSARLASDSNTAS